MGRRTLRAAVVLVGVGLLGSPWAPAQEKSPGPPPPAPIHGLPDLPPLPEPVNPPPPVPPEKIGAPNSFPAPVAVDTTPVTSTPKVSPEPASGFATTPRSNEAPPGRPAAFRLFVPTQRADATQSHYASPPAQRPVEIPVITATPTPLLALEKRGPASITQGQPLVYEIVVRNLGTVPAQQVRVEDELPAGTRLLAAEPAAAVPVQGTRLSWVLDSVPPGTERHVKVRVLPPGAGDWRGSASASVLVSVSGSLHTHIAPATIAMPARQAAQPSNLSIALTGPDSVALGQTAVFQIRLANNGPQPLKGLVLRDHLPPGLQHPAGPELEADLGTLEPGKIRNITLTTKAVQPGRFLNAAMVATADGQQAEARAAIQIMAAARPAH